MESTHPVQYLSLMNCTKEQREGFITQAVDAVRNGNTNPLELRVCIENLRAMLDGIDEQTRAEQLDEAEKYPDKTFQFGSATVTKGETGTKYDYATSGDPDWQGAKNNEDYFGKLRKERETFLKSLKQQIDLVDKETGEVVKINPPAKTSVTSLKIRL